MIDPSIFTPTLPNLNVARIDSPIMHTSAQAEIKLGFFFFLLEFVFIFFRFK